jgi:hypothetical protein
VTTKSGLSNPPDTALVPRGHFAVAVPVLWSPDMLCPIEVPSTVVLFEAAFSFSERQ